MVAVAPDLFIVFLARILGGLSAGNVAITIAYVADKSEAKGRRQAIGFVSAAMGLGTMVGPALGGALSLIGLAVPFLLAAGLSLASIVTTFTFLPEDNRGSSRIRYDSRVFGKGKHPSNQARCGNQTLDNATTAAPFSLTNFLRGIADLVALPNAKALLTALAKLYLAFSLFASQLALVLHARYQWGGEPFGPTEIGLLFTAAGATNILIQVVVVRAIRTTFQERTLAAGSFALLAVGFALIGFGDTIPGLALGVFIAASGLALARPTLVAALTLIVPAGSQGVAMGLAQSLASLINIIGPIAGGLLIQRQNFIGWATLLVALALTGFAVGLLSIFPTKSNPTERSTLTTSSKRRPSRGARWSRISFVQQENEMSRPRLGSTIQLGCGPIASALLSLSLLSLLGCAAVPLEQANSLTSYDGLTSNNGRLTKASYKVSSGALGTARTIYIEPTKASAAAAVSIKKFSDRALVANVISRALCIGVSDRFEVVSTKEDADLVVHATITQIVPTNATMAGLPTATTLGASLFSSVPVPRLPMGLGGLSVEAEATASRRERWYGPKERTS